MTDDKGTMRWDISQFCGDEWPSQSDREVAERLHSLWPEVTASRNSCLQELERAVRELKGKWASRGLWDGGIAHGDWLRERPTMAVAAPGTLAGPSQVERLSKAGTERPLQTANTDTAADSVSA